MHPSAYNNCLLFFQEYCLNLSSSAKIVDLGSYDVNGTVKPIFEGFNYVGVDMSPGPNVDIVADNSNLPFENNSVDIICSTSCFEHDECFWETFLEMVRIVKPNGFIYINAPSAGFYHGYPGDSWRFYADAPKSLTKYAIKKGYNIKLIKSYIDVNPPWHDNVSIYQKL